MIFQFRTTNINFFPEDQEYFEKKLFTLKKFLGAHSGDKDTVDVQVALEKNKHESGNRFEAKTTMHCPNGGKFYAEVSADTIRKCADTLESKLQQQIKKFHDTH